MSNTFIKKIVNIALLVFFIFLSGMSGFKIYKTYMNSIGKSSINDLLAGDIKEEEKDDLNVPISETDVVIPNKNNSSLDTDDSASNTGAKYDKYAPAYKLEILNLEILSNYISTKGNELSEVYYSTLNQVGALVQSDHYTYIDESSISFNSPVLKFTLMRYSNDKKISDVTVTLLSEVNTNNGGSSSEIDVQGIDALTSHMNKPPDYFIYVHQIIIDSVKKANPKVKTCIVDKNSISKGADFVSFDVLDLDTKAKITTIKLDL